MTARQQRFADEYLIDLNATQAAIRAGYSEKTANRIASENLSKLDIQEYIQKRMDEKSSELIAKQDEVLRQLTSTLRREETESVVVVIKARRSFYDENGKKVIEEQEKPQIVQIPAKLSDVNKAAELLGKYHALWTDKTQIDADMKFNVTIDYGEDNA